jgi:hypothetical protein
VNIQFPFGLPGARVETGWHDFEQRQAAKTAVAGKERWTGLPPEQRNMQLPVFLDIDSPPAKMLHIVQNLRSSPKCLLTSHDARFSRPALH